MDPWEEMIIRLLALLQEDTELHTAAVNILESHTEAEKARADHERALAERARR